MERSGRDRSKKVAAVEAGLKQAAENKRRKIGNPKKQKKMKTATAVALLAEFPSAPVTAVLDQTTVVTPMVKTLLDYCVFFVLWYFLWCIFEIWRRFYFLPAASNFGAKIQINVMQKKMKTAKVLDNFHFC
jgi:ABC-type protease/lipase transport system fused ATPase/permease subunit